MTKPKQKKHTHSEDFNGCCYVCGIDMLERPKQKKIKIDKDIFKNATFHIKVDISNIPIPTCECYFCTFNLPKHEKTK